MYRRLACVFVSLPLNQRICVKGWVQSVRKHKKHVFIDISDGTCSNSLQLVLQAANFKPEIHFNCSVEAIGVLVAAKAQPELQCQEIRVIQPCHPSDGYPFQPVTHDLQYLRQFPHLRSRVSPFNEILRVRHAVFHALHAYFLKQGFIHIDTPVLTGNDCEGSGKVFAVQNVTNDSESSGLFFSSPVYLTVSGQLHLESSIKGETGLSTLHLAEFHMVEAEIAFLDQLTMLIQAMDSVFREVIQRVMDTDEMNLQCIWKYASAKHKHSSVIMSYEEAIAVLQKHNDKLNSSICLGESLRREHEFFLVEYSGNRPVFIVEWPQHLKPFYTKVSSDSHAQAVDLLVANVGELIGGTLREDDPKVLFSNLESLGSQDSLEWYYKQRVFGGVPTGGFGMGLERFLLFFLGLKNIRDVIPFPRWPHHCKA